jgi:hypothetical protein
LVFSPARSIQPLHPPSTGTGAESAFGQPRRQANCWACCVAFGAASDAIKLVRLFVSSPDDAYVERRRVARPNAGWARIPERHGLRASDSIAIRQAGADLHDIYVFRFTGSAPNPPFGDPNYEKVKREWEALSAFLAEWFRAPERHKSVR